MKGADAKAPSVDADLDGRDRPRLRPPPGGDSVVTPTPSQWSSSGGGGTPASGAVVPESTAPRFAAGTSLSGRYRIVRFIAAGGMGEVYEAEDLALGAEVALKTMRPELAARPTTIARFRREILLARRVTHPNVCRIFDLGQHLSSESGPEVAFLTMELLSGQTLGQALRSHGPMSVDEALPLVAQMAAALGAAHDAGVVHRDFKAANVMLVPARSANAPPRVVVTDFGIASAAGGNLASITRSKDILGTPAYVAPEQVEGREVTAAADIYALGVVLYEVVTGRLPFEGASVLSAVLKRFRDKPAAPRHHAPDLPARWDEVILRCLERDPRNRFRSTDEVVKALRGEAPPRARETTGRGRMLAACLTAAALTAAGPYLWTRRRGAARPPPRRAGPP